MQSQLGPFEYEVDSLYLTMLLKYFELYQLLQEVVLQLGTSDSHIWRLYVSGQ
jgi:hypothetical protein